VAGAARPARRSWPDRPPLSLLESGGASGYRLEVAIREERRSLFRSAPPLPPRTLRDPAFERAVAWAAERVGARLLHVEGAAGLPPESLLTLAREKRSRAPPLAPRLRPVLSPPAPPGAAGPAFLRLLPRPPPLRRLPGGDAGAAAPLAHGGAALLAAAAGVVFSSPFLERAHADLFGPLPGRGWVVSPALPTCGPLPGEPPGGPIRHLAWSRGPTAQGGRDLPGSVGAARPAGGTDLAWSAYGGGDPALLARLRRAGVRLRGYYRPGALPALLRRDRIDLALLPSIVPESFSLVLSECRAAGVPVLAFDLGAVGERLREGGGGLTVPLAEGAAGLAALAAAVVAGNGRSPHGGGRRSRSRGRRPRAGAKSTGSWRLRPHRHRDDPNPRQGRWGSRWRRSGTRTLNSLSCRRLKFLRFLTLPFHHQPGTEERLKSRIDSRVKPLAASSPSSIALS